MAIYFHGPLVSGDLFPWFTGDLSQRFSYMAIFFMNYKSTLKPATFFCLPAATTARALL